MYIFHVTTVQYSIDNTKESFEYDLNHFRELYTVWFVLYEALWNGPNHTVWIILFDSNETRTILFVLLIQCDFWTLIIALLQPNPNLRYEKMLLSKIDSTNTLGRPTDESQYQGLGRTLEATSTSQKPHNEKVISRLFSKRRHTWLVEGFTWPKI